MAKVECMGAGRSPWSLTNIKKFQTSSEFITNLLDHVSCFLKVSDQRASQHKSSVFSLDLFDLLAAFGICQSHGPEHLSSLLGLLRT